MITRAMGPDGSGGQKFIPGSHLDVIDCTVCHVQKKSMAVRALDCTSGNRYPTMVGFDYSKGMMACSKILPLKLQTKERDSSTTS